MRKNENVVNIEGYVYDKSKLKIKESGPQSKNPGTVYISGDLEIAVDEEGLNIIPVHFTYTTAFYASGKANNSFTILQKIIETENNTWLSGGKENAVKVKIDCDFTLNNFFAEDGSRVAAKRVEGRFVNLVSEFSEKRNIFRFDMLVEGVRRVEADPEKYIEKDYDVVHGLVFSYNNAILPIELNIYSPGGMEFFENLEPSGANPYYTKLWGKIENQKILVKKEEEAASWGETAVTTFERKRSNWNITGMAKVPYEFGEPEVMTAEDIVKARQDREVMWAEEKKRHDDYLMSRKAAPAAAPAKVPGAEFRF